MTGLPPDVEREVALGSALGAEAREAGQFAAVGQGHRPAAFDWFKDQSQCVHCLISSCASFDPDKSHRLTDSVAHRNKLLICRASRNLIEILRTALSGTTIDCHGNHN